MSRSHRSLLLVLSLLTVAFGGCLSKTSTRPVIVTPSAVTDLAVTGMTDSSATVSWTAVGSDGNQGTASTYDLRYAHATITSSTWTTATRIPGLPVPHVAGVTEQVTVAGLAADSTYYFALEVANSVPAWSSLSNVPSGKTAPLTPAPVNDLAVAATTDTSATLTWTAVGSDGHRGVATAYDLRCSHAPVTASNWDAATRCPGLPGPLPAGSAERFTVNGLASDTTYYFALKVANAVPAWSDLSNVPSSRTMPNLYLPQSSPANCLANLITAYINRDLPAYGALFSSDFTFVFSEADVINPTNPTPVQWGLGDETISANHMFYSSLVDKIELTFLQDTAVDSGAEYAGTWKVDVSQVNLLVYTRQDGTPWIYRVSGGADKFYFKEYPAEHARNGQPLWRIWRWEDQPVSYAPQGIASPATKLESWGQIKHSYR